MLMTSKKNTLVYLDEELVRNAKESGLNISQITEKALKERMSELSSRGKNELEDLYHSLPPESKILLKDKVKRIRIANYGCFRKSISFEFSEGLNLICGGNGSGKTTIIDSLSLLNLYYPKYQTDKARIDIQLYKPEKEFEVNFNIHKYLEYNEEVKCIIIDDVFPRYSIDKQKELIQWLIKKFPKKQIILTDLLPSKETQGYYQKIIDLDKR